MNSRGAQAAVSILTVGLFLTACGEGQEDPSATGSSTSASPASPSEGSGPEASGGKNASGGKEAKGPNGLAPQPDFNESLPADVTAAQLEELIAEQRIPVAPTHGGAFETMTNALTLQPRHDVMLFGDSMTQQGVDPEVLGELLSEEAGREVSVFNAASSRARWGVNTLVARYAASIDKLPDVAVLVVSTRAAENDAFYSGEVQHTPFSHVVEGCDRPAADTWTAQDATTCRRDVRDLRFRYRQGGGQVEWALDGNPLQQTLNFRKGSHVLANGQITHPGISEAAARKASEERGERGFPGFPTTQDAAVEQFTELVDFLESEGVTVITTEVPYTPAHQDTLEEMGRDYDQRRQEAARSLAEAAGVEHFPVDRFGSWWGDGSSRDAIHLAPEGAKGFSRQLVEDVPGFGDAVVAGLD
ncbi:hypothetical protein SAMN05445756_0579 [Kytococcus aerolatus]|uniref:GDSL-like Lipase/Acylhydrolase family protein n=1 Tax=Kytococcus aerolatus TaxID=592308 RepID=A0A212T7D5_9MICO|nr:SGNH/GDSL hydrolase family protein [Kytococcus aerolatus]SNC61905.1 hypothetical protein SAMN05445756_0579 [Kytococcus aerolatus]